MEEDPLDRDHFLSVVLPGGLEKHATVHGSKPVMDVLVTLCANYHLNPTDYTVEVLSPNKNNIAFKPNSPIGSLEAEKIVLKPKGVEEKIRRPYMPEATVRLLINYHKSHKTVVRVNPRVPLKILLPAVCDKCEFEVDSTVLFRDRLSKEPLDLTKTLNEHGLREVFAKDTAQEQCAERCHETTRGGADQLRIEKKQNAKRGFFALFRKKKKKKAELERAGSTAASTALNIQTTLHLNKTDTPAETPKKRRAPQPPVSGSQSVPSNMDTCHLRGTQSTESTLRMTKRKAPPPPCANTPPEVMQIKGSVEDLNSQDLQGESDKSESLKQSWSPSLTPNHPPPGSSSSSSTSQSSADVCLPVFGRKDFYDARSALAKVLVSSVSKGSRVSHRPYSAPEFPARSVCLQHQGRRLSFELEPEWQDPLQRPGTTTFKVVPSNKQVVEKAAETLDRIQLSLSYSATPDREHEDYSSSPSRCDVQTPLMKKDTFNCSGPESPPLPPLSVEGQETEEGDDGEDKSDVTDEQKLCRNSKELSTGLHSCRGSSVSADIELWDSETAEGEDLEKGEITEEDTFPPPPSPVFFDEDSEVVEEQEDASTFPPPSTKPVTSGLDEEFDDRKSTAQSRFAQAVALAVQRYHLRDDGTGLGPRASTDSTSSTY